MPTIYVCGNCRVYYTSSGYCRDCGKRLQAEHVSEVPPLTINNEDDDENEK
jgi:rRNA maturation protein Nop10